MEEHIQNVVDLLKEAIDAEDWALVSEATSQLENVEFKEFEDLDY
jgi:hypothetical protein